jgi:hypothetical protein
VALASLAFLLLLARHRADLVDRVYGTYTGCHDCFAASVWGNDAFLVAGFVALLAASRATSSRFLRTILAMLAAFGIAAYATDLAVFRMLTHRLLVADALKFAPDTFGLIGVARPFLQSAEGWRLIVESCGAGACAAAAILAGKARVGRAGAWLAASLALVAAGYAIPQARYVHRVGFENLWQVNVEVDGSRDYSAKFRSRLTALPAPAFYCEAGLNEHPSVILLVVESLSAYHSRLFSGLNDYTPNLDNLARRGAYFTRFFANGYSTEGGLISLLTGHAPLPTVGWSGSTMSFTDVEGDFHRWLKGRGYKTAFFTSGEISFGARDRWLRAIGIDDIEGADHPFYDGMPRGSFGAAEDEALIDRFLQWHARRHGHSPFMATVLTVATHPPFYSPGTRRSDEAASVREIDRQIGRLAATLESRGFFRQGILIIVGDHRAMTPIPASELATLGVSAPARIPAVVVGASGLPRGEEMLNQQQLDLIPSLRHVIGERSCRDEWQGQFLGGRVQPARYVVRADGLNRNQVVVEEGNREYRVVLDGDETRWEVASAPGGEDARRLLDEINRERILR